MKNLSFLFAVHNHQPVGNFDDVFDMAFRDCYLPFLRTVADYPFFKFALHFSGPLWDRMKDKERECWALVELMAERGQVELLSGGYYEPILAVIPERDRAGQIELMNNFLERNFKRRPRGLWLTERVWEPQLPRTLAERGIAYTLLDEEHFRMGGSPTSTPITSRRTRGALSIFSRSTRSSAISFPSVPSKRSKPPWKRSRRGGRGHPGRRRREVRPLARDEKMGLRGRLATAVPRIRRTRGDPDPNLFRIPGRGRSGRQGLSPARVLRGNDGVGPRASGLCGVQGP